MVSMSVLLAIIGFVSLLGLRNSSKNETLLIEFQVILQHKSLSVMDWEHLFIRMDGMIGLTRRRLWNLQSEY